MGSKACSTEAADDDDGRSSAQVLFRWEHPGSRSVAVSGAWCAWSETATPLLAERGVVGRDSLFKGELRLPHGKHLFRFFVDGMWRHDPQLLSERDEETGELCNIINVSQESELRLQLPEKLLPDDSAEAADYMNSLREYGLRTPKSASSSGPSFPCSQPAPPLPLSSSSSSSPPPGNATSTATATAAVTAPGVSVEAGVSSSSELPLAPPVPTPTTSGAQSDTVAGGGGAGDVVGGVTGVAGARAGARGGGGGSVVAAAIAAGPGKEGRGGGGGEGGGAEEEEEEEEEQQQPCNGCGGNGNGSGRGSAADAGGKDSSGSANANAAAAAAAAATAAVAAAATTAEAAAAAAAAGTSAATAGLRTECASVTYRRRQQESFSAVGSCMVTSSVRKDGKLLVAMVGLPARGKSFVARSIARHLDWVGLKSRTFSLGMHRRKEIGVFQPAEYFEPGGEGEKVRRRIASEVLAEALTALKEDIDIAIYDASNITRERRLWLAQEVAASGLRCKVVFIESICNDEELVRRNVLAVRQSSPEYEEKTREEAEVDFLARISRYESIYQPLESSEGFSFIKLIDVGNQMITNLISGYIPGRITLLCLNLHLKPRPIWMSRHGESEFNMQGRIGGDAPLTAAGQVYAGKLAEFMKKLYPPSKCARDAASADGGAGDGDGDGDEEEEELVVWTSTMLRTGQTVAPMIMEREVIKWSQLTEISAGLMDSLTYAHVAAEMPQEYEARLKDKLRYRYPAGESYQDLFTRLEPVLFEMLRQRSPLLVVGHQAILRVLYGYLTGKDPEECPTLDMPLHTAIKLTPMAYTCEEEWHRPLEECDEPVIDVKHPISDAQSA